MARGIVARKSGTLFVNSSGVEFELDFVRLLPDGHMQTAYDTHEEYVGRVTSFKQEFEGQGYVVRDIPLKNKAKAAITAGFTCVDNPSDRRLFIREFYNVKDGGLKKWPMCVFAEQTGLRVTTGAAAKEVLPFKPSDLIPVDVHSSFEDSWSVILENATSLCAQGLMNEVNMRHLEQIRDACVNNTEPPLLEGGREYIQTYSKYLGEVIAPLALIGGWNVEGDIELSQERVLDGAPFMDCYAYYSNTKTNQLYDSTLVAPHGKVAYISSKAGSGAATSLASIEQLLVDMQAKRSKEYSKLKRRYRPELAVLEDIVSNPSDIGVIEVGARLGLLSERSKALLMRLKGLERREQYVALRVESEGSELDSIASCFAGGGLYDVVIDSARYQPYYHILAGLAKHVANQLNKEYRFSPMVKDVFAHSPFIQVSCSMRSKGRDCWFHPFKVIYPPEYDRKVKVNAGKNFYSTEVKGRLSFKF